MWSSGFLVISVQRTWVLTLQFHWAPGEAINHPVVGVSSTTTDWGLTFSRLPASRWLFKILLDILAGAETGPQNCSLHLPSSDTSVPWLSPCRPGTTSSPWLEKLGGDSRTASGAKHVGLPPTELSLSQGQASLWSSTSAGGWAGSSNCVPAGTEQGCTTHSPGLAHLHHNPSKRKDTHFTSTC